MRFSIANKILAAYLTLAVVLVSASCYGLYSLRRLQATVDKAAMAKLELLLSLEQFKLNLALLEQTGLADASRDLDAKSESIDSRLEELGRILGRIVRLAGETPPVGEIKEGFGRYLDSLAARSSSEPGIEGRALFSLVDGFIGKTQSELEARLVRAESLSLRGYDVVQYLVLFGLVLGLGPVVLVILYLKVSLGKLQSATRIIAEGVFDHDPQVRGSDEVGDLAQGLKFMAQKLKTYEQLCLDASPLTRLPGNIAIERALLEKIRRNEKFALCYADLDDFKAYNDRYGYAKGSEIIKVTGEILHEAKRRHGRVEDFVGHIGGDDFVLISLPESAPAICENIIQEFDRVIPYFYSQEDREKGFIESADRYGIIRQFPVMTISIAVVSDVSREIVSPTEIAQVAAEIKEFVKTLPGSNYLVDRRRAARTQADGGAS